MLNQEIICRVTIREDAEFKGEQKRVSNKDCVLEGLREAINIIEKNWGKPIGKTVTGREILQSHGHTYLGDEIEVEYNEDGIWEEYD